jgi:hypothetical protein
MPRSIEYYWFQSTTQGQMSAFITLIS